MRCCVLTRQPLLYTINAGDTLYIPAFWWHWVMSEGDPASIAVNFWTNKPHRQIFLPGCDLAVPSKRCGHEPELLKGAAQDWPAMNWTVDFIRDQVRQHIKQQAAEQPKGTGTGTGTGTVQHGSSTLAPTSEQRFGSCATADHLYPEMYSAGVLDVSRYHQEAAPPIPASFDDIATAITQTRPGECCHAVLEQQAVVPPEVRRSGGIQRPVGALPPSANAGKAHELLWVTGGNVTSGLHFDQDYNSLTVLSGTKRVFLFDPIDSPHLYSASKHVQ